MNFPEKVVQAIYQHLNISSNLNEVLTMVELRDDWVVWRKENADRAGGLRLVVPKTGSKAFEIPSSANADDQHGVSYDYAIHVLSVGNAAKEAAIVLERYTGMSRKEAYQGLKSGFSSMSTYFVANPLALIRELRDINVHVHLVRPGDRGGYTS